MGEFELLTPEEVAKALRVSVATLQKWRSLGYGPRWTRLERKAVRYFPKDVRAFMEHGLSDPQHQMAAA